MEKFSQLQLNFTETNVDEWVHAHSYCVICGVRLVCLSTPPVVTHRIHFPTTEKSSCTSHRVDTRFSWTWRRLISNTITRVWRPMPSTTAPSDHCSGSSALMSLARFSCLTRLSSVARDPGCSFRLLLKPLLNPFATSFSVVYLAPNLCLGMIGGSISGV